MAKVFTDWISQALQKNWIEYVLVGFLDGENVYRVIFTDRSYAYYYIDEDKEKIEKVDFIFPEGKILI